MKRKCSNNNLAQKRLKRDKKRILVAIDDRKKKASKCSENNNVIHFNENSCVVQLKYSQYEIDHQNRLQASPMFNVNTGEGTWELHVWGAPFPLFIHKRVLKRSKTPITKALRKEKDGCRKLYFDKAILLSLSGGCEKKASCMWKSVWAYVGLLYGININCVCIDDHWIITDYYNRMSMDLCMDMLFVGDFLCDEETQQFIVDSITHYFLDVSIEQAKERTSMLENSISSFVIQRMIDYLQKCSFEKDSNLPLLNELVLYIVLKRPELFQGGSYFLYKTICDFKTEKHDYTYTVVKSSEDTLRELVYYLIRYEVEAYKSECKKRGSSNASELFFPVCNKLWWAMTKFKQPEVEIAEAGRRKYEIHRTLGDYYERDQTLCRDLDLAKRRLKHYWNAVFEELPEKLTAHLVVSGSIIPMCIMNLGYANFAHQVSTLFLQSDMDVYVFPDQNSKKSVSKVVREIVDHLKQKDMIIHCVKNLTKDQELNKNVLTITLSQHPILGNIPFRVQLIYYDDGVDVRAPEVILRHHLCPVRGYYCPSSETIYLAPTAIAALSTGYIRYLRTELDPESMHCCTFVFKYIQRRFGVIQHEGEYDGESSSNLITTCSKILSMLPDPLSERMIKSEGRIDDSGNMLLSRGSSIQHLDNQIDCSECKLVNDELFASLNNGQLYY